MTSEVYFLFYYVELLEKTFCTVFLTFLRLFWLNIILERWKLTSKIHTNNLQNKFALNFSEKKDGHQSSVEIQDIHQKWQETSLQILASTNLSTHITEAQLNLNLS